MHQATPDRDLPQWQFYKTAGEADEIRIRLNWPAGLLDVDSDKIAMIAVRTEIRRRGTVPWLKMPVVHFKDRKKGAGTMRKEIRLLFSDTAGGGARINFDQNLDAFAVHYRTGFGQSFAYVAESYFTGIGTPTDQLPIFTAATTSGHTASASSTSSGQPWNAADNIGSNTHWSPTNNTLPGAWWKAELNTAKTFLSFAIRAHSANADTAPSDFTLEGSNDDTNWTEIGSYQNVSNWTANFQQWFGIETPGGYFYYRFMIARNNGAASEQIQIQDISFALTAPPGSDTNMHHRSRMFNRQWL